MKMRLLSLLLCVAMVISLVGCGGTTPVTPSATPSATASATPEAVVDSNINLNPSELPIIKDPSKGPTFKVAVSVQPARVTKANDLPQIKRLAKETGVVFEWIEIPSNGLTEKINLMLSGGEDVDAYWDCISDEMVVQYMGQDVFMPLEDLTAKYMPNLTSVYEKRPQYKGRGAAPDGHYYGFPYIEEMYGLVMTPGPFMINQEWLTKVNKPMPTTVNEWVDVLRAFKKAGDLNGNGKADEVPYAFGFGARDTFGSFDTFYHFTGAFGLPITNGGNRPEDYMSIKDGKVIFGAADPAFKETAKFFNGLYSEGLIDIDSFSPHPTANSALYIDKIKGAEAVLGSFGVWSPVNSFPDLKVRAQYTSVPRLQGEKGKTGHALNFSEMHRVAMFAISSKCEQPEILARFVDHIFTPELSVTGNWGSLGYAFKKGADGVLRYDLDSNNNIILKDGWKTFSEMAANTRGSNGPTVILNEYYDTVCEYAWDAVALLEGQKVNGKVDILKEGNPVPRMLKFAEEQAKISQIQPQIKNIVEAYRMEWILKGNADATWDKYLADLKAAGLDDLLLQFQKAYDRYLKSSK